MLALASKEIFCSEIRSLRLYDVDRYAEGTATVAHKITLVTTKTGKKLLKTLRNILANITPSRNVYVNVTSPYQCINSMHKVACTEPDHN